jgi:hypothetical protein
LILASLIMVLFLRDWGTSLVAGWSFRPPSR